MGLWKKGRWKVFLSLRPQKTPRKSMEVIINIMFRSLENEYRFVEAMERLVELLEKLLQPTLRIPSDGE